MYFRIEQMSEEKSSKWVHWAVTISIVLGGIHTLRGNINEITLFINKVFLPGNNESFSTDCTINDPDRFTYVRDRPSESNSNIIDTVKEGEKFKAFLIFPGDWVPVITNKDKPGYIYRNRIKPLK